MDPVIVFASTCPICMYPQVQDRFTAEALHRLLDRGHPIEAYCTTCRQFWSIALRERAALARTLLSLGK
jgi:hypothetical protein